MFNYNGKIKIFNIVYTFVVFFHVVSAEDHHYIEVNYEIDKYKFLHVNETLELICKNKLNGNPPSWIYPRRLYNNPRVKFNIDVGESRMVISKAEAEDAGKYECEIEHEYQGKTLHFRKEIEVIVNVVNEVEKKDVEDGFKLLCNVKAYPSAEVKWKIDYDNKNLNPPTEEPDPDDDYWMPSDPKVVVEKSNGRFKLLRYKGVENAELLIENATENDNGNYSCVTRNLVGEVCKDCNVKVKRAVRGAEKASTATSDKSSTVEPENINSQEGLGAGAIALITIVPIAVLIASLTALIHRIKRENRKEKKRTEETVMNGNVLSDDEEIIPAESTNFQDYNSRNIRNA